ncbi:MAG: hypothetical protein MAG453_01343 [Calditrichaeota bacterium]|nr:hypothetical protein [Calditrichota bacterium]
MTGGVRQKWKAVDSNRRQGPATRGRSCRAAGCGLWGAGCGPRAAGTLPFSCPRLLVKRGRATLCHPVMYTGQVPSVPAGGPGLQPRVSYTVAGSAVASNRGPVLSVILNEARRLCAARSEGSRDQAVLNCEHARGDALAEAPGEGGRHRGPDRLGIPAGSSAVTAAPSPRACHVSSPVARHSSLGTRLGLNEPLSAADAAPG